MAAGPARKETCRRPIPVLTLYFINPLTHELVSRLGYLIRAVLYMERYAGEGYPIQKVSATELTIATKAIDGPPD